MLSLPHVELSLILSCVAARLPYMHGDGFSALLEVFRVSTFTTSSKTT